MFANQKISALFNGAGRLKRLPALCLDLLSDQKKEWQGLREGYESFRHVRERTLCCTGFSVRLQYNRGRIKSSTAAVGGKTATEQPCFLCLNRLPEAQKGILYRGDYVILCNPMPVFSSHFTVSHLEHRPQSIAEPIDTFLTLMTDFGPGWMVLYNGPRCGASAPDHLHFQVAPSGQMPFEKEIQEKKRLTLVKQKKGVCLYRVNNLGREAIILEGNQSIAVGDFFRGFLDILKKELLLNQEPMINMAGFYKEKKWHLVIFLRRKHRPDAFFREGAGRIVVSPGAVDMGGVLITPMEKDFDRLDEPAVEGIFREVSLEGSIVERTMVDLLS